MKLTLLRRRPYLEITLQQGRFEHEAQTWTVAQRRPYRFVGLIRQHFPRGVYRMFVYADETGYIGYHDGSLQEAAEALRDHQRQAGQL